MNAFFLKLSNLLSIDETTLYWSILLPIILTVFTMIFCLVFFKKPWKNALTGFCFCFAAYWAIGDWPAWYALIVAILEAAILYQIAFYLSHCNDLFASVLLGCIQQKNQRLFVFYVSDTKVSFPAAAVATAYLDEERDMTASLDSYKTTEPMEILQSSAWWKKLVIPEKIDRHPVTDVYLPENATPYLQLPTGLKRIRRLALSCGKFKEIVLPKKLEAIEDFAFAFCDQLEQITLPSQLEYVGKGAFQGCRNLETVIITNPNLRVEADAFMDCARLKTISAPSEWKEANQMLLQALPAYRPDKNDLK